MSNQPRKAVLLPVQGRPGVFTYSAGELDTSRYVVMSGVILREIHNNGFAERGTTPEHRDSLHSSKK